MFQIESKSLEYLRPLLADSFNFQWPGFLVVQLAGFFCHALGGYAAGRHEDMRVVVSCIMAALGRVYRRISGDPISAYQKPCKALRGLPTGKEGQFVG